jgi:RNA polymerase sigma-70 factor (ECF subfamily)
MCSWSPSPGSSSSDQAEQPSFFVRQIDEAKRGESEALSALYREFLPVVFGYIAVRVSDRATAEDLTSEVFLKMIEGISRLRATEKTGFAAWILQIARISVAGYYRNREGQPTLVSLTSTTWEEEGEGQAHLALPLVSQASDPAIQAEAREAWREVVVAINALSEEQRQVLVSRLILGYDVETVGRMLGKKGKAIKAVQFRALHMLHRLLRREAASRQALPSQIQDQGGVS